MAKKVSVSLLPPLPGPWAEDTSKEGTCPLVGFFVQLPAQGQMRKGVFWRG